ncbi:cytochrome P450 [Boletus coccyginus]|nr:cytochrome P450 [Boletus coccyginus]
MASNTNLALASAFVVVTVTLAALFRKKRRLTSKERYPLPLGPPAPWFWNNVMPTVNIGSTFVDWAYEYGPVIALRQGSEVAIVIARVDAATEIMEKEGSALADRPPKISADELLSGGNRITLIRNGERFRRFRRAIHTHLQVKAVEMYKDTQFEQARTFILDILNDPKNYQKHANRYSASVILRITYGKSGLTSVNDPDFVGVGQAIAHFIEVMRPGAYLVDRFSWLKYIPGYGRRLRKYYESDLKFYKGQLKRVERAMSLGVAGLSFSRTLLENVHDHQLSIDEMSFLAGTLFEAGTDTPASPMHNCGYKRSWIWLSEWIDCRVGMTGTLFLNFTLLFRRLSAGGPLCLSVFRTVQRGTLSGYDVLFSAEKGLLYSAGTTVTGNLWAISRDPVAFPDPEKFDPRRWLDQNGQLRDDVKCYPFGFGRRVCPGMHLANRSLFIVLALLLWSFRVVERPEAPIDTTPDTDNVVAHLAHFEVDFVPRTGDAQLREMMQT